MRIENDSTAYEKQRERVNKLLGERSKRFGDYDASLQAHTGIFGFKTKKDMQASINILQEIVKTDQLIFKETKALLDFKDIEKQAIQSQASTSGDRINGYIQTISKLQRQQDQLQGDIKALHHQNSLYLSGCLFAVLALCISLYLLFAKRKGKTRRRS